MRFSDADMGIYEKIHRYYSKMQSYSAEVRLAVKGNKTENVYELEQYALGADKTLSRIKSPEALHGLETVTSGDRTQVRYGGTEQHRLDVAASEDVDVSFVTCFLRYYYQSEETAVSVSASDSGGTTLLETELPPESARRKKASMLIDNKTLAPKNITVYDMGGNIVFIAEFVKFVYNDTVKDKIFEIAS